MFFTRKKKKPFVDFIRGPIPEDIQRIDNEPRTVFEMRVRTETAWQNAMDEINRERKAALLAEYRECLKVYRRQVLICLG